MHDVECWVFTIIFLAVFIALGITAHISRKRENRSPIAAWAIIAIMFFLVMFQMYLVYRFPPPGGIPQPPCWLKPLQTAG